MFRIGDFAKIARVSVKTLHYYDEIGLLKPEQVHTSTGYRYYTLDQLPRLNRILALKDLGFTLSQISSMLDKNLSPDSIRGMLYLKEAELEQTILEEQEHLESVRVRLRQIEHEGIQRDYDILIKPVEPKVIAFSRGIFPLTHDTYRQCEELANAIHSWLSSVNSKAAGCWRSIYHETASENQNERIDIEMAVEVERAILEQSARFPLSRDVFVRELPGSKTTACLLHQGHYDGLWDAHIALMAWIQAKGYCSAGSLSCMYLRLPMQGDKPLTELQIPIEQAH